jgi:hypothetical protein
MRAAGEQDLRCLAGVVSSLPGPGAFSVRSAERRCHRGAKRMRIDRAAAFEITEQQLGGREERNARVRS